MVPPHTVGPDPTLSMGAERSCSLAHASLEAEARDSCVLPPFPVSAESKEVIFSDDLWGFTIHNEPELKLVHTLHIQEEI